jgi:acetyl esterase/lipase
MNMDFEANREVLRQVVAEKAAIRHISKHRLPDGKFDLDGNKKIWNGVAARFKQIKLWENGTPGFVGSSDPLQTEPSVIFIPAVDTGRRRGTVIVAHGGGFESRTGCEGFNVADYFVTAGFNAAVLTYRIKPYTRYDAIADMQRAIRVLRARSGELGITQKVAVMGFSAGGMLSGNCATHFDYGSAEAADPAERFSCRPDAAVVAYGAFTQVSFPGGFFDNPFTDEKRGDKLYLSIEKNISTETPPFFIWQTNGDDPRLSMNLAWELTDHGVPFELHCFPDGAHGLALADGNNDLDTKILHLMHWSELCAEWLEAQGL